MAVRDLQERRLNFSIKKVIMTVLLILISFRSFSFVFLFHDWKHFLYRETTNDQSSGPTILSWWFWFHSLPDLWNYAIHWQKSNHNKTLTSCLSTHLTWALASHVPLLWGSRRNNWHIESRLMNQKSFILDIHLSVYWNAKCSRVRMLLINLTPKVGGLYNFVTSQYEVSKMV